MPRLRTSMQDIRLLLRYYHTGDYSKRQLAYFLGLSPTTVRNYFRRLERAQITWPLPEDLCDDELEALLFPDSDSTRPQPDWKEVHKQLTQRGMTLILIWRDWKEEHPDGYSYAHFCACYRQWAQSPRGYPDN